jgi:hypothetical protein
MVRSITHSAMTATPIVPGTADIREVRADVHANTVSSSPTESASATAGVTRHVPQADLAAW